MTPYSGVLFVCLVALTIYQKKDFYCQKIFIFLSLQPRKNTLFYEFCKRLTGLIDQAARSGILTPWEVQFLTDTKAKRALTAKQEVTRNRINSKLISSIGTTAQESLEQLKKSQTASPNVKLIDKALEQKVIRPQDSNFLKQISAKAHEALSDKQKSYKTSLNQRIINQIKL